MLRSGTDERGKYLGLMFSWSGIGFAAALGSPVGGALAQSNWRWISYIILPICGVFLVCLVVFMHVKTGKLPPRPQGSHGPKTTTESHPRQLLSGLSRLDYLDIFIIFIPSMISLLWVVVMGGGEIPWSPWRIIVALVLDFLGWIASTSSSPGVLFRQTPLCSNAPIYQLNLGRSFHVDLYELEYPTSRKYFFPVYFQAVKGTTVLQACTYLLPFAVPSLVVAVASGTLLNKLVLVDCCMLWHLPSWRWP